MQRRTRFVMIAVLAALAAGVFYGLSRQGTHEAAPTAASSRQPAKPAPTSPSTSQPAAFDKQQYSLDDPASIWVVVDKQRPLNPKSYAPADLTLIGSGQYMRAAAASAYSQMAAGAKAAGYTLVPESGYRSYDTQVSVYGNEVKNYGQATADSESARPGYSEHQTGWAVDIASPGCIEDCFGTTAAGAWVLAHAANYGFIQRYPESKSDSTGYRHEPWHFRYVGTALSKEMAASGQTLEEFFGLPAAPNY